YNTEFTRRSTSASSIVHPLDHRTAGGNFEQFLDGLLPGRQRTASFELVQTFKRVSVEAQPGTPAIVPLHQIAPNLHWQPERGLGLPGNLRGLQALIGLVKAGAAEQEAQGYFAVIERREVFRGCDVEIERAIDGQIDLCAVDKWWHQQIGVRPEH